ncbi:MAG: alanine racemase [Gammaproteobacteria bacterium]|nr:alanine racemase [Gammaproteobacteria bacterium]
MICHAVATIDHSALRHNLQLVRAVAPRSGVIAVIKANAYGHNVESMIDSLDAADLFGVAHVGEAVALRQAGCTKPLLVLEGFFDTEERAACVRYDLQVVVHHQLQIDLLRQTTLSRPLHTWLKIDTGMHRLGFALDSAAQALQQLQSCRNVASITAMSHFAGADELDSSRTERQLQRFNQVTDGWNLPRSMANSAGVFSQPQSHFDWVRPGIALYGISPFGHQPASSLGLRPVMTLRSCLMAINDIKAGEAVGYGATWRTQRDTRIGVIGIGYGDGYPRHARNGTPVLVNGRQVPLAGRVSMDMICVDLGPDSHDKVGDPVVLWGKGLAAEVIADYANTIAYELVCGITSRVRLDHVHS